MTRGVAHSPRHCLFGCFFVLTLLFTITSATYVHHDWAISSRQLQATEEQAVNPAFAKCYEAIDQSIAGDADGGLTQDDYISFLAIVTDGRVSASTAFADLPLVYVLIFYSIACSDIANCAPGSTPAIETATTTSTDRLCRIVLAETDSTTTTSFQYSIRYDTSRVDGSTLGQCLSTATVNLVLDRVAQCSTLLTDIVGQQSTTTSLPETRRQLRGEDQHQQSVLIETRDFVVEEAATGIVDLYAEGDNVRRMQEGASASSQLSISCPYSVSSVVEEVDELGTFSCICCTEQVLLVVTSSPSWIQLLQTVNRTKRAK